MKPDWKDAPEWAQWLAINDCGEWWWFEFEPHVGNASWRSTCGRFRRCDMLRNPWRETLERRPELLKMEAKRKLPEKFLTEGIALAEDASIFGARLSDLSRDELLAVAAQGWKAHQNLLIDNASRSRPFSRD